MSTVREIASVQHIMLAGIIATLIGLAIVCGIVYHVADNQITQDQLENALERHLSSLNLEQRIAYDPNTGCVNVSRTMQWTDQQGVNYTETHAEYQCEVD